jgi:hypothetical protein
MGRTTMPLVILFAYRVLGNVVTEIFDEMAAIVNMVGAALVAGNLRVISQNSGENGGQESL